MRFETYISHAGNRGSIPRGVTLNPLVLDSTIRLCQLCVNQKLNCPLPKNQLTFFLSYSVGILKHSSKLICTVKIHHISILITKQITTIILNIEEAANRTIF